MQFVIERRLSAKLFLLHAQFAVRYLGRISAANAVAKIAGVTTHAPGAIVGVINGTTRRISLRQYMPGLVVGTSGVELRTGNPVGQKVLSIV